MGMFSAAKDHAPNATLCYLSSRIRAQKNKSVDYLDSLQSENRDKVIKLAITIGRKQRGSRRNKSVTIKQEILKRIQKKKHKKEHLVRMKVDTVLKKVDFDVTSEYPDVGEIIQQGVQDILAGKVVGRRLCHVWCEEDSKEKTVYNGKVEKLLKKASGTYVVGYWKDHESYDDDSVDYDMSKYAFVADLLCGDLTLA